MSHMSIKRFYLCILVAASIFLNGCGEVLLFTMHPINQTFARHSNPIAGWQKENNNPDEAIEKDYNDYLNHLSSKEKMWSMVSGFYKDGKGQHAITIDTAWYGTSWTHVLIYDQHDKRIKVIKYVSGYYGC
jgi:hypothetical protein